MTAATNFELDAGETTLHIGVDHPALAGHFPGRPIVPGVVLLDEALFAIASAHDVAPGSCRIGMAKFLQPVTPPATLTIRHRRAASGAIDFAIDDGSHTVASGRIDSNEHAR